MVVPQGVGYLLVPVEQIISRTVPLRQRFVQLWAGEPGHRDNLGRPAQLPAAWLIDKTGKVVIDSQFDSAAPFGQTN